MLWRLVLILACGGLVAQSGPLPACLWDEVILSWVTGVETACVTPCLGLDQVDTRSGNDTPEDIALDAAQQQMMGSVQTASSTPHADPAFTAATCFADVQTHLPPDDRVAGAPPRPVDSFATPPPAAARNLPLLI